MSNNYKIVIPAVHLKQIMGVLKENQHIIYS